MAQTFTTEATEDTEQRQGFNNDGSDVIEREGADICDLTSRGWRDARAMGSTQRSGRCGAPADDSPRRQPWVGVHEWGRAPDGAKENDGFVGMRSVIFLLPLSVTRRLGGAKHWVSSRL